MIQFKMKTKNRKKIVDEIPEIDYIEGREETNVGQTPEMKSSAVVGVSCSSTELPV